MKKNSLYILLGLAAVGAAWYYMKKKKGTVTVPEPEKISEQEYTEAVQAADQEPKPMAALYNIVSKAVKPKNKNIVIPNLLVPSAPTVIQKKQLKKAKAVKKSKAKKVGEISVIS